MLPRMTNFVADGGGFEKSGLAPHRTFPCPHVDSWGWWVLSQDLLRGKQNFMVHSFIPMGRVGMFFSRTVFIARPTLWILLSIRGYLVYPLSTFGNEPCLPAWSQRVQQCQGYNGKVGLLWVLSFGPSHLVSIQQGMNIPGSKTKLFFLILDH